MPCLLQCPFVIVTFPCGIVSQTHLAFLVNHSVMHVSESLFLRFLSLLCLKFQCFVFANYLQVIVVGFRIFLLPCLSCQLDCFNGGVCFVLCVFGTYLSVYSCAFSIQSCQVLHWSRTHFNPYRTWRYTHNYCFVVAAWQTSAFRCSAVRRLGFARSHVCDSCVNWRATHVSGVGVSLVYRGTGFFRFNLAFY